MATVSKPSEDKGDDRVPVPPYPAEDSGTWQAFHVTLRDDGAGGKPDATRDDSGNAG